MKNSKNSNIVIATTYDSQVFANWSKSTESYMSIGEAEEFRFYFDDMPIDLLFEKPNPQFPDNIKVRYWDERWQDIIFGNAEDGPDKSYLDRIIDAGFDGVYLDIVSGFEFFGPKEIDGNGERETAARNMVDFVINIADYARNVRGKSNFKVVPQNGPGIIDPPSYSFADDPELEAEKQKQRYFSSMLKRIFTLLFMRRYTVSLAPK